MIKDFSKIKWVEIPRYNGVYLISNFGNIYNTKRRRFMSIRRPTYNRGEYVVHLCYNGVANNISINTLLNLLFNN